MSRSRRSGAVGSWRCRDSSARHERANGGPEAQLSFGGQGGAGQISDALDDVRPRSVDFGFVVVGHAGAVVGKCVDVAQSRRCRGQSSGLLEAERQQLSVVSMIGGRTFATVLADNQMALLSRGADACG